MQITSRSNLKDSMHCAFSPGSICIAPTQIKVIKACILLYLFQEVLFPQVLKSIILLWAKFLYCIMMFYKYLFCFPHETTVFSRFMSVSFSDYKPVHMWVYVLCGEIALFFFGNINYWYAKLEGYWERGNGKCHREIK